MKIRHLFIADPIEKLNPKADTTLAMLRAAVSARREVYWATSEEVEFSDGIVWIRARKITACGADELPETGTAIYQPIEKFSIAHIRKDPPFDVGYVRLCWILALAERKLLFLNSPSRLLRYHEKLVPLEALAAGFLKKSDLIRTHYGNAESTEAFLKKQANAEWVTKPLLGHGGRDIQLHRREELLKKSPGADRLVQPFLPEVRSEDRRLLFIRGKLVSQFVRIPPEGSIVANLVQGGRAEARPLSRAQLAVALRIGRFLKRAGIFFAGGDLIGPKVSEVNITSPTGFRSVEALRGPNLGAVYLAEAEKQLKSFTKT